MPKSTDEESVGRGPNFNKTRNAVLISPLKLISNGFFTPRGPQFDHVMEAVLRNVVYIDNDSKKFK